jgi:hypothetical protein
MQLHPVFLVNIVKVFIIIFYNDYILNSILPLFSDNSMATASSGETSSCVEKSFRYKQNIIRGQHCIKLFCMHMYILYCNFSIYPPASFYSPPPLLIRYAPTLKPAKIKYSPDSPFSPTLD